MPAAFELAVIALLSIVFYAIATCFGEKVEKGKLEGAADLVKGQGKRIIELKDAAFTSWKYYDQSSLTVRCKPAKKLVSFLIKAHTSASIVFVDRLASEVSTKIPIRVNEYDSTNGFDFSLEDAQCEEMEKWSTKAIKDQEQRPSNRYVAHIVFD